MLAEDDAEARALAGRLTQLETVRDAVHIGLLLPAADPARDALVAVVREDALAVRLPGSPAAEDTERIDAALNRMRVRFTAFERGSFSLEDKAMVQQLQRLIRAIERIRGAREEVGAEEWSRRVLRSWRTYRVGCQIHCHRRRH